jgi:hypothetical protein
MEDLIDMIAADESPSQISDKIKEILFSKSSERVDALRPSISQSMFDEISDFEESEEE